ncbi:MAG: chemotaxis protein CheW [Holosporales bacterium]
MDDLLVEFLTETNESLEKLDLEIVRLEQNPGDMELVSSIFRIMHTIKGTCGFLGLPRLESVAHAAEDVMGKIRDGKLEPSVTIVSLIFDSLDQIKFILAMLGESGTEPEGDDSNLIAALRAMAEGGDAGSGSHAAPHAPAPVAAAVSTDHTPVSADSAELEAAFAAAEFDPPTPDAAASPTPAETSFENALDAIEKKEKASATKAVQAAAVKKAEKPKEAEKGGDKDSNQTIRVGVGLLENLMNLVSELVLTRNQLLQISRSEKDSPYKVPLQRLGQVTSELQESVMKTRMQPIGNAWNKLPRIIRDLSNELNKKIDLVMIGEDTELDRQVLEMIKDPLTHMVRNSADHGVEQPADRINAGKPEIGTVRLEAYHEGGYIIIKIADDGKGLNMGRIKAKILETGLSTEDDIAAMSDEQLQQYIFKAGFSTAAKVTSVSGRGVGMDVVRTNIEKIGGTVGLWSVEGQGSTFTIKIPLTLAIVSALIVGVAGERFAIPQLSVTELVRVSANSEHRLEYINGVPVLRLRERLLPLVSLHNILNLPAESDSKKSQFIIVSQVGNQTFGLIVDKVYDTEEIVVKPVAPILRHISVFSGNTILGDGSVIMILDPNGVAAKIGDLSNEQRAADADAKVNATRTNEAMAMLVFSAASQTPLAVPLALVSRLEEVDIKDIEYSNGQALVQYRGSLMPLLTVTPDHQIGTEGVKPVLVFSDNKRSMGVIVDSIIDIVEEAITINLPSETPGFIGSAIIRGKATDLLDAHYYIHKSFSDWFRAEKNPSTNSEETGGRTGRRLLLVDDSAFFRNLLAPVLHAAGYDVVAIDHAQKALDLRDKGEMFDVIISDIEMPDIDGIELAQTITSGGVWADIPCIALSVHTDPDMFARGRAAGFVDYVPKFDRDALIQTLAQQLNGMSIAA